MAKGQTKQDSSGGGTDSLDWALGLSNDFQGYVSQSRSLALSFVLIAPLLLVYEVALIHYHPFQPAGPRRWVAVALFRLFSSRAVIVMNVAVVLFLLLAVLVLARRGRLKVGLVIPVVLESTVLAAVLVLISVMVYRGLSGVPLDMSSGASIVALKVIGSIGAGVYEEILFRLFLTTLLYLIGFGLFGHNRNYAALFAILIGAIVFAVCHVLVVGGRPFQCTRDRLDMVFYLVSGMFFSALYVYRGLGVAVYTHVIYDMVIYLGGK